MKLGIDISSHQKNIDWVKVKSGGKVDFAIIRVGFRSYKDGVIKQDKYYKSNVDGCIKNNIPIGHYFFSTATSINEAIEEAEWVYNQIKDHKVEYPVSFDYEHYNDPTYRNYGKTTKESRTEMFLAFSNYLRNKGYECLIYGSKAHVKNKFNVNKLRSFNYWLAYYKTLFDLNKPPVDVVESLAIWQYSSKGKINGINGYVDMNCDYGTSLINKNKEKVGKAVTIELHILKNGCKGEEVKTLQRLLNALGYKGKNGKVLDVDGQFGSNTLYAVKAFQKAEGLSVDGCVGAITWGALLK